MCLVWYVRCGVRWYVCVDVPPSSAPSPREHLCECMNRTTHHCAEHRALQAQTIHRYMRGACIRLLPPIDPESSSVEGQNGGSDLLVSKNRPLVVERRGRGAER